MRNFREIFEETDLIEEDNSLEGYELAEKMFTFIENNIDVENLDENQSDAFNDILEAIANLEDEEEELDEAAKVRKKISASVKRERKLKYRKNKAVLKRKAKKFRKTAKFKKYKKKAKRAGKRGKTATGKRQTKFIR